jgi:hypothetical protein
LTSQPSRKNPFDLAQEPAKIRDLYGREEWGQSFLVARRLFPVGGTPRERSSRRAAIIGETSSLASLPAAASEEARSSAKRMAGRAAGERGLHARRPGRPIFHLFGVGPDQGVPGRQGRPPREFHRASARRHPTTGLPRPIEYPAAADHLRGGDDRVCDDK